MGEGLGRESFLLEIAGISKSVQVDCRNFKLSINATSRYIGITTEHGDLQISQGKSMTIDDYQICLYLHQDHC